MYNYLINNDKALSSDIKLISSKFEDNLELSLLKAKILYYKVSDFYVKI